MQGKIFNFLQATVTVKYLLPLLNTRTLININSMELEVGAVLTGDLSQQIINKVLDIIDRIADFIASRIDAAIAVRH